MSGSGPKVVPLPFFLGKRIDDLTTLSKSRLLRGLDVKEIAYFFDALDQVNVEPGVDLVSSQETEDGPRHLGFVLEGSARVKRGDLEIGRLSVGDHYGERILLRQSVHPFQVMTDTPSRVARLTSSRFESLAERHPRLALDLIRAIAATATDDVTVLADRLRALVRERSLPRAHDLRVTVGSQERLVATGTAVGELFPGSSVVAAKIDGRPVMLDTRLSADAVVEPIVAASALGDEVIFRSAGLVILDLLARRGLDARVLPPLDGAIVVEVAEPSQRLAEDIARAADERASEPGAFVEELWTLEEAKAYFVSKGKSETASLLDSRPASTVTLSRFGDTFTVTYGPCTTTLRELGPLVPSHHPRGLLVEVPRAHRGDDHEARMSRERAAPRFGSPMADEHRRWLDTFGARSVGALTELATSGRLVDLVRAGEAFHEKALGRIADDLARRAAEGLRVIRVAGPSSSGKTTFIRRLTVALALVGIRTVELSLDDYYVDRETTVRDEAGEYDFESPLALDAALLCEKVGKLASGAKVLAARYDFMTGKSHRDGGAELVLRPRDLLLVEGLHALEPAMVPGELSSASAGIFVHPATTLPLDQLTTLHPQDLRLLRRIVRDRHSRGYRALETIARWPSVRRGEELHVFARLPSADHVFDTALAYEPCVLKLLAERCLLEVPRHDPAFVEACRLRELLAGFVGLEAGHVPTSSILREFIGHGPG